ncbi:MAG TPA: hypothetical protein EYN25_03915 [Candidatus Nitrosopelagicus sp.]|nr:hypothetical protein [Candidatus Nitrosopelagicus sp.]
MNGNLLGIIDRLSSLRPIFNMEKDFQLALGWEIQKKFPDWSVRFEHKPTNLKDRIFVDLWIKGDQTSAIELKYKTRKLDVNVKGESFNLLDQAAQDLGRYDFLKDVERLENIVSTHNNVKGYAVILTNDSAYWKSPTTETVDAEFRIHEGRILNGELAWGTEAGAGTMRKREKPIKLTGTYKLSWKDYSQVSSTSYGKFRYLFLEI